MASNKMQKGSFIWGGGTSLGATPKASSMTQWTWDPVTLLNS